METKDADGITIALDDILEAPHPFRPGSTFQGRVISINHGTSTMLLQNIANKDESRLPVKASECHRGSLEG